jgi:RNA polymerase sigma-70 factor (ECF subfamily)
MISELVHVSDEDLLFSSRGGHQDAFAELMDRYQRLVYRVACRILRDRGEAEDMVQHVFLKVYQRSADFDPTRGTVRTWLLQFAHCHSIERLRYLSRRRFYQMAEIAEIANRVFITERCPVSGFENCELVRHALEELNETQRRVIHLSQFEGHSLREIAEQSGETYGSVRHHFYRGLRKMRVVLVVRA